MFLALVPALLLLLLLLWGVWAEDWWFLRKKRQQFWRVFLIEAPTDGAISDQEMLRALRVLSSLARDYLEAVGELDRVARALAHHLRPELPREVTRRQRRFWEAHDLLSHFVLGYHALCERPVEDHIMLTSAA